MSRAGWRRMGMKQVGSKDNKSTLISLEPWVYTNKYRQRKVPGGQGKLMPPWRASAPLVPSSVSPFPILPSVHKAGDHTLQWLSGGGVWMGTSPWLQTWEWEPHSWVWHRPPTNLVGSEGFSEHLDFSLQTNQPDVQVKQPSTDLPLALKLPKVSYSKLSESWWQFWTQENCHCPFQPHPNSAPSSTTKNLSCFFSSTSVDGRPWVQG